MKYPVNCFCLVLRNGVVAHQFLQAQWINSDLLGCINEAHSKCWSSCGPLRLFLWDSTYLFHSTMHWDLVIHTKDLTKLSPSFNFPASPEGPPKDGLTAKVDLWPERKCCFGGDFFKTATFPNPILVSPCGWDLHDHLDLLYLPVQKLILHLFLSILYNFSNPSKWSSDGRPSQVCITCMTATDSSWQILHNFWSLSCIHIATKQSVNTNSQFHAPCQNVGTCTSTDGALKKLTKGVKNQKYLRLIKTRDQGQVCNRFRVQGAVSLA
jgi:hypothetical protein